MFLIVPEDMFILRFMRFWQLLSHSSFARWHAGRRKAATSLAEQLMETCHNLSGTGKKMAKR
jgi:hypothetical protein